MLLFYVFFRFMKSFITLKNVNKFPSITRMLKLAPETMLFPLYYYSFTKALSVNTCYYLIAVKALTLIIIII